MPDVEAPAPSAEPEAEAAAEAAEDGEPTTLKAKSVEKSKAKVGEMLAERGESGAAVADIVTNQDTFILRGLVWIVPGLYAFWYGSVALMMFAFGMLDTFTGFEPFDHINFTPAVEDGDWLPLINFLSMVIATTVAGPWLIFFATRDASRATDCSQAVMSLHFFLCTTVTQQTPENWIFWATFMPSGLFMGRMAEFMLARFGRPRFRWIRRKVRPVKPE